jgi:hypothetical protein
MLDPPTRPSSHLLAALEGVDVHGPGAHVRAREEALRVRVEDPHVVELIVLGINGAMRLQRAIYGGGTP